MQSPRVAAEPDLDESTSSSLRNLFDSSFRDVHFHNSSAQHLTIPEDAPIRGQPQEVSITAALQNLLFSSSFADVKLQGTDAVVVHAHRAILAARSQVFERLLFGRFAEATEEVVKLSYDGEVLKAIVEYCYTDHVSILDQKDKAEAIDSSRVDAVVNLSAAADYFGFPKLSNKVTNWCAQKIDEHKSLAWVFFVETDRLGANPDLLHYAMDIIRNQFNTSLSSVRNSTTHLLNLTPPLLEKVLADNQVMVDEIDLFCLVETWVGCCDNESTNPLHHRKQRRDTARDLVSNYIRLGRITPSDIRDIVEPAGLVMVEQILAAYKNHALHMESNIALPLATKRGPSFESSQEAGYWCTSSDHCTELLQCRKLRSGVHIWAIKVIILCHHTWLGVAASPGSLNRNAWLGESASGWVYGSNGCGCHAHGGSFVTSYPTYGEGSIIKFRLDLRRRGTLHVSVGEGEEFMLFDDMLMQNHKRINRAFVPASSLKAPGAIQFLGFHPSSFNEDTGSQLERPISIDGMSTVTSMDGNDSSDSSSSSSSSGS